MCGKYGDGRWFGFYFSRIGRFLVLGGWDRCGGGVRTRFDDLEGRIFRYFGDFLWVWFWMG